MRPLTPAAPWVAAFLFLIGIGATRAFPARPLDALGEGTPVDMGSARPLREPLRLGLEAPQGIAIDGADGSLWIHSATTTTVLHVSSALAPMGSFEAPFADAIQKEVGGVAYNPLDDTLLLGRAVAQQVWEVTREGAPTGRVVTFALPAPPNIIPRPFAKGLAFDPEGEGGAGSLWIVESVLSAVYEVSWEGVIVRSFCAPDDPDGCPGDGLASSINDVELRFDAAGDLLGFEVTGGRPSRNRLLRLTREGAPTGEETSLAVIGGRPGGFARGLWRDPASGAERPALFVTVESSAELWALEDAPARVPPIRDLACAVAAGAVALEWTSFGAHDRVRVLRERELIATLPGDATRHDDAAPPAGVLRYEVLADAGELSSRLECEVVTGAGEVLRSVPFEGHWAVDLAEDAAGLLFVTDVEGRVVVYDKELALVTELPSPFSKEDGLTAGIAYNPRNDTLLVLNATTLEVAEMDRNGEVVTPPFPLGLDPDVEEPPVTPSLLFNPDGDGGRGSLWVFDLVTGRLEERALTGSLLGACAHPDHAAEPSPPGARFYAQGWGMTTLPGRGFETIVVPGGRARDPRTTRIFPLATAGCVEGGDELPAEALGAARLALHWTLHGGRETLFVISSQAYRSRLLEALAQSPAGSRPMRVRGLEARWAREADAVELSFQLPPGATGARIERSGSLLVELEGPVGAHVDSPPPRGPVTYCVRALRGAEAGDDREVRVVVGPAGLLDRAYSFPATFASQVVRDPSDGTLILASANNAHSSRLYRFGPDLRLLEDLPAPFLPPMQTAGLAARASPGRETELLCLGWSPGAAPGGNATFPLVTLSRSGSPTSRIELVIPRPPGSLVTYPTGLAWDPDGALYWVLERNAAKLYQFSEAGELVRALDHPAPIHQDGVFNFGLTLAPRRGVAYLTSAGPLDLEVTRIIEMTLGGLPTGVSIPVGDLGYRRIWGFDLDQDGAEVLVAASDETFDIVRAAGLGLAPAIVELTCRIEEGARVLEWTSLGPQSGLRVYRETLLAATLPGVATSWRDEEPIEPRFYRVVGVLADGEGPGAACEPRYPRMFLRGDVEENGILNITDAVAILVYLFVGGRAPACLDAADVNDLGDVSLTDAVALLGFLFLSRPPPAPPFPEPGLDPTPDALDCAR